MHEVVYSDPAWMFSGKNVIFMATSAGISDTDMQDMQRFGCRLVQVLNENPTSKIIALTTWITVKIDEK